MSIGLVIDGIDHFMKPIEAALRQRYTVARFEPSFLRLPLVGTRVNEHRLTQQLSRFLREHNVVFFEWAGPLASRLPGRAKRIVRAHRTELLGSVQNIDWSNVDGFEVAAEQKAFSSALLTVPIVLASAIVVTFTLIVHARKRR